MTNPAVSVVVPCYNGGRFIDRMLASLDSQTFRDFETVVVDDGSTDPETIDKLDSLPVGIRVVRQPNKGLPAARNTGFREARSDFVLPLDCDDSLAPSFLAEMVELLLAAPPEVGFVFSDVLATGAINGVLPRKFDRFDQLFLNRLPYCLLLRKSTWLRVGGYDESMRDGYEDWEFNIRLTLAGYRGLAIDRPLFIYFVSHGGMLMSHSARLHGRLWRGILKRHPETYNWQSLRRLRRRWREPGTRFGLSAALLLTWGSKILPTSLVGAVFYRCLQLTHWLRVRCGVLTGPEPQADSKAKEP